MTLRTRRPDVPPPGPIGQGYREAAARRRELVLRHPQVAELLRNHPYRSPDPSLWSGYIPSHEVPTEDGWRPNPSPIRRYLTDVVALAQRHETDGCTCDQE